MKTIDSCKNRFIFESTIGLIHCIFEENFLIQVIITKNELDLGAKLSNDKFTSSLLFKRELELKKEYPLFLHELREYFYGTLKVFNQPIKIKSGTIFDRRVWSALREIPYGETITYKELAMRVGSPQAQRAIGSSLKKNPLPIILPCHRVISAKGNLCGYSSGLEIKRRLLEHEGVCLSQRCLKA